MIKEIGINKATNKRNHDNIQLGIFIEIDK